MQSAKVCRRCEVVERLAIVLTIRRLHWVKRASGDSIDIQWREIDDLSLWLCPGEPNDLPGEISYNSDNSGVRPTHFHKGRSGEDAKDVRILADDAGCSRREL
jgi:hypothetical protein